MTKRRIYLHGMKFIDTKPNITKENTQSENNNKKLTKDRKIKLDKIIKSSGFKEIYNKYLCCFIWCKWIYLILHLTIKMKLCY